MTLSRATGSQKARGCLWPIAIENILKNDRGPFTHYTKLETPEFLSFE
jgi:hypothetical protein